MAAQQLRAYDKKFYDNFLVSGTNLGGFLFNMDSAHDELFDETLASVTTDVFGPDGPLTKNVKNEQVSLTPGVTGEDRYLWWMQQQNFFKDVVYFAVLDYQSNQINQYNTLDRRAIWWVNNGDIKTFQGPNDTVAMVTSKFLEQICTGNPPVGNNSFRFQTIHDAGIELLKTHMPTASNFIDSASTPSRDKIKNHNPTPQNYDTPAESDCVVAGCGDPINQTIMSKNNEHWYGTKYSLLIYDKIIKPIMIWMQDPPNNLPSVIIANMESEKKNMMVVNFIWQLTLYFTLKSTNDDTGYIQYSVWYLSHLKFVRYSGDTGRQMFIQIIPTQQRLYPQATDPIEYLMKYFAIYFFNHMTGDTQDPNTIDYNIISGMEETVPFDVSQAKCAKFINELLIPNVHVHSRTPGLDVDIISQPFYLFTKYWCETLQEGGMEELQTKHINKTILQILKFSGDTSHLVQTIVQLDALKVHKNAGGLNRYTILTTLERILSSRMIEYMKAPNSSLTSDLGVMWTTGVYLQKNDPAHSDLITKLKSNTKPNDWVDKDPDTRNDGTLEKLVEKGKNSGKKVSFNYFGIYVPKNISAQILELKNKMSVLITNITNTIASPMPVVKVAVGVWSNWVTEATHGDLAVYLANGHVEYKFGLDLLNILTQTEELVRKGGEEVKTIGDIKMIVKDGLNSVLFGYNRDPKGIKQIDRIKGNNPAPEIEDGIAISNMTQNFNGGNKPWATLNNKKQSIMQDIGPDIGPTGPDGYTLADMNKRLKRIESICDQYNHIRELIDAHTNSRFAAIKDALHTWVTESVNSAFKSVPYIIDILALARAPTDYFGLESIGPGLNFFTDQLYPNNNYLYVKKPKKPNSNADLLIPNSQFLQPHPDTGHPIIQLLHDIFYVSNTLGRSTGIKGEARGQFDEIILLKKLWPKPSEPPIPPDEGLAKLYIKNGHYKYKNVSFLSEMIYSSNNYKWYNDHKNNIDILIILVQFFLESSTGAFMDSSNKPSKTKGKNRGDPLWGSSGKIKKDGLDAFEEYISESKIFIDHLKWINSNMIKEKEHTHTGGGKQVAGGLKRMSKKKKNV